MELREGGSLVLTERVVDGTAQLVSQTCAGLARVVGPGQPILLDDGLIELRVEAVEGSDIRCTVRNSGLLGERKSVNIPGASVAAARDDRPGSGPTSSSASIRMSTS